MKETCRSARDFGGLMAAICVLMFGAMALGTLVTHAEGTNPSSPAAAAQTPSPARRISPTPVPSPTPTPINWSSDPMLKRFVWRGIGPASMGGRIDDIAAVESNSYIYYVGFATGGVAKTGI